MQIERHELRCFHAVIEAGGFSRAAERLDLSQSAVSQAIANLEHRLGTSLLRRRQSAAADRGRLSAAAIRTNVAERGARGTRGYRPDQDRRAVDVVAGALAGRELAGRRCAAQGVLRAQPAHVVEVVVAPSREIVHGVAEGRWELGFGPFHHNMPAHFALHPCFSETRRLMIARDHPARAALSRDAVGTMRELPLVTSLRRNCAPLHR